MSVDARQKMFAREADSPSWSEPTEPKVTTYGEATRAAIDLTMTSDPYSSASMGPDVREDVLEKLYSERNAILSKRALGTASESDRVFLIETEKAIARVNEEVVRAENRQHEEALKRVERLLKTISLK